MGARENLQKLADRKAQEIMDLERQIDRAGAYLQAIQDAIKSLPKDLQSNGGTSDERSGELRPGSLLAKARDAIQVNGAPMHVSGILKAIGVDNTKGTRVSLVGSLGSYVRKGQVFTRPAPNTFGLVGMKARFEALSGEQTSLLPETFGSVTEAAR
jgi:hypothetical protein